MENHMNTFVKILNRAAVCFAVLFVMLMAGCDSSPNTPYMPPGTQQGTGGSQQKGGNQSSGDSQPPATQQALNVSYDLPDGWEWLDTPQDLVAIWHHASKVGDNAFVKLEPEIHPGTDADAKNEASNRFATWKQECTNMGGDCLATPEYKEMEISGTTIYMAMDKIDVEAPGPYWETEIDFSKDGYLVTFLLGDRGDLYTAELTRIINTLKISQ